MRWRDGVILSLSTQRQQRAWCVARMAGHHHALLDTAAMFVPSIWSLHPIGCCWKAAERPTKEEHHTWMQSSGMATCGTERDDEDAAQQRAIRAWLVAFISAYKGLRCHAISASGLVNLCKQLHMCSMPQLHMECKDSAGSRQAGRQVACRTEVQGTEEAYITGIVVINAAPAKGHLGEGVVKLADAPAVCGQRQVVLRPNLALEQVRMAPVDARQRSCQIPVENAVESNRQVVAGSHLPTCMPQICC